MLCGMIRKPNQAIIHTWTHEVSDQMSQRVYECGLNKIKEMWRAFSVASNNGIVLCQNCGLNALGQSTLTQN